MLEHIAPVHRAADHFHITRFSDTSGIDESGLAVHDMSFHALERAVVLP